MDDKYILFTRPTCIFCKKAIAYLNDGGYKYNTIEISPEQGELSDEVKRAYEWNTFPMVFHRDKNTIKFIGGYTDLVKSFEQEKTR